MSKTLHSLEFGFINEGNVSVKYNVKNLNVFKELEQSGIFIAFTPCKMVTKYSAYFIQSADKPE